MNESTLKHTAFHPGVSFIKLRLPTCIQAEDMTSSQCSTNCSCWRLRCPMALRVRHGLKLQRSKLTAVASLVSPKCSFALVPLFGVPQWGSDTDIKDPFVENPELKGSPFKAWSRSEYSPACYTHCQGSLPGWFLPSRSIHLHPFPKTPPEVFLWLLQVPVYNTIQYNTIQYNTIQYNFIAKW